MDSHVAHNETAMNTDIDFCHFDEHPINKLSEDRLGRAKFAENIAKSIDKWNGRASYVLALYGDWGSGKSSVKNMIVDSLEQIPSTIKIVHFEHWQILEPQQLAKHFFDEISIAIKRENIS